MPRRPTTRLTWATRDDRPPIEPPPTLAPVEIVGPAAPDSAPNLLVEGDNRAGLHALLATYGPGAVDLAYLDPPFVSRARYTQTLTVPDGPPVERPAFTDTWASLDDWLDMFLPRLRLVHTLLRDGGSVYVHLDWRAAHYARVLLDEVFGADNYRNEIVWKRAATLGRKAASSQFGRVTDTLLWYTKGPAFTFNRLTVAREVPRRDARWDEAAGRWFRTAPRGDYTETSLAALEQAGRIHHTRNGRRRVKYFLDETPDGRLVDAAPLDNLWLDIPDMMHIPPAERTGYPTQKPLALLDRIIRAASNPGDLVLDPFAGAGTTLLSAARLGRRWWGLEASHPGVAVTRARLRHASAGPFAHHHVGPAPHPTASPIAVTTTHAADGHLVITLADPGSLEYWAVGTLHAGVFHSRWQGCRGYDRAATPLPHHAVISISADGAPLHLRWETLTGERGLLDIARLLAV